MKDKTAKPWKSRQKPCEKVRLSVPFVKAQNTAVYLQSTCSQLRLPNIMLVTERRIGSTTLWSKNEQTISEETMVQQQQSTTQQHWAAWATHHSETKNETVVHTVTHRVVSPGYGWLPGGIWIHGVNDCLSLPFLVDLAKASTGLSVRGLSLEVLLIFIHIVHLEVRRSEVVREKGEWLSLSLLTPFPSPPILQRKTHIPKTPPSYTIAPIPPPPSHGVKIEVCVGCTIHIYVKGFSQDKKAIERNTRMSEESEVRVQGKNSERNGESADWQTVVGREWWNESRWKQHPLNFFFKTCEP